MPRTKEERTEESLKVNGLRKTRISSGGNLKGRHLIEQGQLV
jgi:hypothetical protein